MDLMKPVSILGATGFIGRHLISQLQENGILSGNLLVRKGAEIDFPEEKFSLFSYDFEAMGLPDGFIEPGATVINLSYISGDDTSENLRLIDKLCDECIQKKASRILHCSTAVVVGNSTSKIVDEETSCHPTPGYEFCKLSLENHLIGRIGKICEVVVLRPTAVFGRGGLNLNTILHSIKNKGAFYNLLKSSFLKDRRMNLVSVEKVVAAIIFFIQFQGHPDGPVFIVADDDVSENSYGGIYRIAMETLGRKPAAQLPVPFRSVILKCILRLFRGRSIDPDRIYSDAKLRANGFKFTDDFSARVSDYALWYYSQIEG